MRQHRVSSCAAVTEIIDLAIQSFVNNDAENAALVEPLEQVVDTPANSFALAISVPARRMFNRGGICSVGYSDKPERVADHCSNIAGCDRNAKTALVCTAISAV